VKTSENLFQLFIHPRKTAVRLIAGDIKESAFLPADGTNLRRLQRNQCIAATTAFPSIFRDGCFGISHDFTLLAGFARNLTQNHSGRVIFFIFGHKHKILKECS
jgi:hypothetical protein